MLNELDCLSMPMLKSIVRQTVRIRVSTLELVQAAANPSLPLITGSIISLECRNPGLKAMLSQDQQIERSP